MWDVMRDAKSLPRRHPRLALTSRFVKSIKANGRVQRIADGNGLYLLVGADGGKRWVLRVVAKGKRCDIGLGSALLVPLADARDAATRFRRVARDGGDPLAERRAARRPIPTFREAAEAVHSSLAPGFKNAKHSAQWLSSLGYVFDAIGTKRVDAVTSADILEVLNPHWLVLPETSRRVLQRTTVIFNWAIAKGFVAGNNPTTGVKKVLPKHRETVTHHRALPYSEVPAFVKALEADTGLPQAKLAFEFAILTVGRTTQVLNTAWDEIDFAAKTWKVPAGRMKIAREHRVPLAQRCITILQAAKSLSGDSRYVFPGRRRTDPLCNATFENIAERMGRADVMTPHGMRSSFRDWAEEATHFSRAVIESSMAHTLGTKVEVAYLRSDLMEKRRQLMAEWADFVVSGAAGPTT
jgi:integrase